MRSVSFAKYKAMQRSLEDFKARLPEARKSALLACAADPNGDRFGPRAVAIREYCGVRSWISHYRRLLAQSEPVKHANCYALAR